jgi:hypothetical protein
VLRVYVTDTEHQQVDDASLSWTWQSELAGALGTSEGMGVIFVHGRRAGQTLALRAVRGDHVAETTTLLGAGVTEAVLTLPSEPSSYDRDTDDEGDTDVDDTVEASTPVSHERVIIRH